MARHRPAALPAGPGPERVHSPGRIVRPTALRNAAIAHNGRLADNRRPFFRRAPARTAAGRRSVSDFFNRLPDFIGNHPFLSFGFVGVAIALVVNEVARLTRG